jgi:TetR/AcrR family transcriptional regulator, cholesterol catabolism regulator
MPRLKQKTERRRPDDSRDRRQEILAIAAGLFAKRGFDGVSVREIADAAGIMGGSLYHHFASKKEIYLEVHSAALSRAAEMVQIAYEKLDDPWERLEAAVAAHLAVQLAPDSLTLPLMSDLPSMSGEMRVEIIRQRDDFEMIYRRLIAMLPLRPGVDREIYRLSLVSLINAVPVWYRTGRLSPEAIAAQISQIFRSAKAAPEISGRASRVGVAAPPASLRARKKA